jgi:anti-sigma factor RsiW
MIHPQASACDDTLLDRYLDGDLDAEEKARMKAHLEHCRDCRHQVAAMTAFSDDLRDRVEQATESVDFMALEKAVLTRALRQRCSRGGFSTVVASLKYIIPVAVTACLLLFFAYPALMSSPASAPSAIINSFTGSVSSVMIFETPETRQTILWYNEDPDVESDQNAV